MILLVPCLDALLKLQQYQHVLQGVVGEAVPLLIEQSIRFQDVVLIFVLVPDTYRQHQHHRQLSVSVTVSVFFFFLLTTTRSNPNYYYCHRYIIIFFLLVLIILIDGDGKHCPSYNLRRWVVVPFFFFSLLFLYLPLFSLPSPPPITRSKSWIFRYIQKYAVREIEEFKKKIQRSSPPPPTTCSVT